MSQSTARILERLGSHAAAEAKQQLVRFSPVPLKVSSDVTILIRPTRDAVLRRNPLGVRHLYWRTPVRGGNLHFHAYDHEACEPTGAHITCRAELFIRHYEGGRTEHYFDLFPTDLPPRYNLRIYQDKSTVPPELLGHQLLIKNPQGGYTFLEARRGT